MKKILLYTDSRGQRIKNIEPYTSMLDEIYECELHVCEEKWTTTIDFIKFIDNNKIDKYDFVVLQTSIVENSPRCKNDAYEKIYLDANKKKYFDKIFGEENMKSHFLKEFDEIYDNDKTLNMFSIDMGVKYLIPILDKITNLIWVSNNPLYGGNGEKWVGDYWRHRPKNMGMINDYSKEYINNINNIKIIDNTNWTDEEIKKYTIDNIHYTKKGHELIKEKIVNYIDD